MSLSQRFDKPKLPSRHVTEGPSRAPHRSCFHAMGITEEEFHRPWVGVATCWNEATPCTIALNRQARSVKIGVKKGGGTPREFTTITVTDKIAMGYEGMRFSLASRDAIADTVELTMRGNCHDALVGLAGCDKSLPGMMMVIVRPHVPSVFIWVAKDLREAGGVAVVMQELPKAGLLHLDCITASGKTPGESLNEIKGEADGRVICHTGSPITKTGGVVSLKGNLPCDRAIVKVAGMTPEEQVFSAPARVFKSEDDAVAAVKARGYEEGEVIVIRKKGPAGGRGMREMLSTTEDLSGQGIGKWVALSDDESAARKADWNGPRQTQYETGAVWKFARLVGGARWGAVTHPGTRPERHVCVDQ